MKQLKLIENAVDVGRFLAEYVGPDAAPAIYYDVELDEMITQVHRIIEVMPADCLEDAIDEAEHLINMVRVPLFLMVECETAQGYSSLSRDVAVMAVETNLAMLESWIEWKAKDFALDLGPAH